MVPAKDVVALEDMLLDALAVDNTVALVVDVEPWDSTEVEPTLDAAANGLPSEAKSVKPLAIRWDGTLTTKETGD